MQDPAPYIALFGRLHPLVLHLPIGLVTGLAALELVAVLRRSPLPRQVSGVLAWLIAVSATVSAASGWLLSRESASSDLTLNLHLVLGTGVALASLVMAIAHAASAGPVLYRRSLLVVLVLLVPTGHLGASMTHGADFLTAPLTRVPQSRPVIASTPATGPIPAPRPVTTGATVAAEAAAVLSSRCTGCHGEATRKAGLALHTPADIARGGRRGPAVVPGKPAESLLMQRVRLPASNRLHMPPPGKPQLTDAQIGILEQWIAEGVPFAPVQPVPQAASNEPKRAPRPGPVDRPPPVNTEALAALQAHLVHVETTGGEDGRLYVDFSGPGESMAEDRIISLMQPLLVQLDTLSLARTAVGDTAVRILAEATGLRRLDLRGTAITDAGLESLVKAPKLQELVLTQTRLTDAAVECLGRMASLQRVSLWKSGVSAAGIARLRAQRRSLHVEAGDTMPAATRQSEPAILLTSDAPPPGGPVAETASPSPLKPVNGTCPVSGKAVDPRYVIVYEGRAVGLCCPKCAAAFWEAPQQYAARLPASPAPAR
jgi:uncharacterized membrane protein/mono/diheme cytochrome c family protein